MALERTKLVRWLLDWSLVVWGLGFGREKGKMGNKELVGLWSSVKRDEEGATLGKKFVMVAIEVGRLKVFVLEKLVLL